jgi:hypothetical protein
MRSHGMWRSIGAWQWKDKQVLVLLLEDIAIRFSNDANLQ